MTDKELEKIYNEAYRAVYWTAMSFLKNEADAEDIVQDTFVSFIKYYSDMNDTSKATALLKKIAANKCLDRIKLTRTDIVNDEFFENVEAVSENFLPDSIIESSEVRKIIMDIINDALSEEIRRTLILFYFNDMSTKEISEKLGVPEGTVRWRLNFARNKIKKEVEKYEEDNDTKLFGMVALPFLSKLFMKEAEQLPMKAMPASLNAILSASKNAPSDGTGIKASKKAVKKGIDIMNKKLLIGCVAGVVAVGASVAIIVNVVNKKSDIGSDSKPSDQLIQTEELQENESENAGAEPAEDDGLYYGYFRVVDMNGVQTFAFDYTQGTLQEGQENVSGAIVIPDGVEEICSFDGFSNITSITIPDGVTELPSHAFANCTNLTEVNLPNTLVSLNDYAFYECPNLVTIVLPASLKNLGKADFSGTTAPENRAIYFPADVQLETFNYESSGLVYTAMPNLMLPHGDGITVYVVAGSWMDVNYESLFIDNTCVDADGNPTEVSEHMAARAYWDGVNP